MHTLSHINLWAVLVAALAAFFLGALWYSPLLFARAWRSANGYSEEKVAEMQKDAPRAYAVSLVCFVVMAAALALLLHWLRVESVGAAVHIVAVLWLGFVATTGLIGNAYSDKPLSAWLIDAGYQLTYLLIMGAILAAWR